MPQTEYLVAVQIHFPDNRQVSETLKVKASDENSALTVACDIVRNKYHEPIEYLSPISLGPA